MGRILFTRCKNQFLEAREELKNDELLQKFWMSFLQMVDLLLSTIYSIRYGDWKLLLQCITRILPYTFAFDHISYVETSFRFQMTSQMSTRNSWEKKFAAQLTENCTFLGVETDKVIEMSLNKVIKFLIKNKFK